MGQWVDYDATIINVFSSQNGGAWIEFKYTIWYVGWRQIIGNPTDLGRTLDVATAAKAHGWRVRLNVTNGGEITAVQTV
jgi:hypothetical protein